MNKDAEIDLSIIVPCFNEADVLSMLVTRLKQNLTDIPSWEVIFVDDGSTDMTLELLCGVATADNRFKVLSFSRNFGHQSAVCAGIDAARGATVGVIDADLQDPPEVLLQCWRAVKDRKADVAYGVRKHRKEAIWKRACYDVFYRLLHRFSDVEIPMDAGDFCVMHRVVVDAIKMLPERNIFMRGLRAWVGFKQQAIEYDRPARVAGAPKYSLARLFRLAADGLFSFSVAPLRLASYVGLLTVALSMFYGIFTLAWRVIGFSFMGHVARELPGWTTLVTGLLFLHGIQLVILGVIGEYIGRVYSEAKNRPRYILQKKLGFGE